MLYRAYCDPRTPLAAKLVMVLAEHRAAAHERLAQGSALGWAGLGLVALAWLLVGIVLLRLAWRAVGG
ncbi:MAG: hypothetical protein WDA03_07370 [Trueperaceae bacterium]